MPWAVRQTGDEWCVFKEGESKPVGCHASRARALAQQRALYVNEATTAAAEGNGGSLKLELKSPPGLDEQLIASMQQLSDQINAVTLRIARDEELLERVLNIVASVSEREDRDYNELRSALTAALAQPAPEPPIVNVTVPDPQVTVNVPEAVVHVTTPTPEVNVTIPPARREISFSRDPLTGQIASADVVDIDG